MWAYPTDGDMVVILCDTNAAPDRVEEWLWDRSAGTFTERGTSPVDTINNNSMGYACGYTDPHGNLYLAWEDTTVGGASDIYYSERREDFMGFAWDTPVEVVGDADYDSGNFSLSGDAAGNIYLFWAKDDDTLQLDRKFEGSWGTEVELDADCDKADGIDSPEENLAVYCFFKDTGDDVHFSLLAPNGIGVEKQYEDPDYFEDFEGADDFDGENINKGSLTFGDETNPFSGVKNMLVTMPANTSNRSAFKYEAVTGNYVFMAARNVRWDSELNTNGETVRVMSVSSKNTAGTDNALAYFGFRRVGAGDFQWWCRYRHDPGGGEA